MPPRAASPGRSRKLVASPAAAPAAPAAPAASLSTSAQRDPLAELEFRRAEAAARAVSEAKARADASKIHASENAAARPPPEEEYLECELKPNGNIECRPSLNRSAFSNPEFYKVYPLGEHRYVPDPANVNMGTWTGVRRCVALHIPAQNIFMLKAEPVTLTGYGSDYGMAAPPSGQFGVTGFSSKAPIAPSAAAAGISGAELGKFAFDSKANKVILPIQGPDGRVMTFEYNAPEAVKPPKRDIVPQQLIRDDQGNVRGGYTRTINRKLYETIQANPYFKEKFFSFKNSDIGPLDPATAMETILMWGAALDPTAPQEDRGFTENSDVEKREVQIIPAQVYEGIPAAFRFVADEKAVATRWFLHPDVAELLNNLPELKLVDTEDKTGRKSIMMKDTYIGDFMNEIGQIVNTMTAATALASENEMHDAIYCKSLTKARQRNEYFREVIELCTQYKVLKLMCTTEKKYFEQFTSPRLTYVHINNSLSSVLQSMVKLFGAGTAAGEEVKAAFGSFDGSPFVRQHVFTAKQGTAAEKPFPFSPDNFFDNLGTVIYYLMAACVIKDNGAAASLTFVTTDSP